MLSSIIHTLAIWGIASLTTRSVLAMYFLGYSFRYERWVLLESNARWQCDVYKIAGSNSNTQRDYDHPILETARAIVRYHKQTMCEIISQTDKSSELFSLQINKICDTCVCVCLNDCFYFSCGAYVWKCHGMQYSLFGSENWTEWKFSKKRQRKRTKNNLNALCMQYNVLAR